jgi:hypothetical protein
MTCDVCGKEKGLICQRQDTRYICDDCYEWDLLTEFRSFLVDIDSLLSLLVHRHGGFMDKIDERKTAIRIYNRARTLYDVVNFASLSGEDRKTVLDFVQFLNKKTYR